MSDILQLFKQLSTCFDPSLSWEKLADNFDTQTVNNENGNKNITSIELVARALENSQVNSLLLELCSSFRILRQESGKSYSNTYDSWDIVIKECPREPYLAFVYALASLFSVEPSLKNYKLSLLTVNTYFYSLTIPGSHGYHIFEEEVIMHCLKVFGLVERVQILGNKFKGATEFLVHFATFLDDLKIILRWVHIGEHAETRNTLIRKLLDVQYYHFNHGYSNTCAANVHVKCFDVFDELIIAYNGPPEETLMKILNMTFHMHTFSAKPKGTSSFLANGTNLEHISAWFTKWIIKSPRILSQVLSFYIKCVITNPIKTWQNDQVQRALDYAATYDSELFINCNESCMDFLCNAIYSDEIMIRSRTIDLMSRMLQINSEVNWSKFRNDVSKEPREVFLIKELIDSLQDTNNGIKNKAMHALQGILNKGSKNAQKVLIECLKYTEFYETNVILPDEPRLSENEVRYKKPSPVPRNYSFEGFGILELSILHLPEHIYLHILQNKLTHIRRAGVVFLEQIVKINPLIIFNTNFVTEMTRLSDEPNVLVRRQCLLSIDNILENYPNCYAVIWVWCKIISPMFRDSDVKNVELAMKCFHTRVLLNMEVINKSHKAEHFMPWLIIRTFLITQSRLYLQTCFQLALQKQMINTKILSIIESHLMIANSTQIEAWVVLNLLSGKVKSNEPDNLFHCFTLTEPWNKEQTQLIAFEVLSNSVQDFTKSTLNYWSRHLEKEICNGQIHPIIVGKALNFLLAIDKYVTTSSKDATAQSTQVQDWIIDLHAELEERIVLGIKDFPDNRATLMSQLYSYSEINILTPNHPSTIIVNFVYKFIQECIKLQESELGLENERVFNSMIIIAGRFSLRDNAVANVTCKLYGQILNKFDRPSIVNTIIVAITDLSKKHTQTVETIMSLLLLKLSSPFLANRKETFKCFEILVLQDQLKLRGILLLSLLTVVLDDNKNLSEYAINFFRNYMETRNPSLFQKCLVECPFVLNEYKNFNGLNSFTKISSKSPLKGEHNRYKRHELYKYFMKYMQEAYLISHFENLNLIADKCKKDPLMKTADGIALVKDILFILRHVCELSKEHKSTSDNKEEKENNDDEELEETIIEMPQPSGSSTPAAKPGRGRKSRKIITIADALNILEKCLIFIPTIYECVHKEDDTIKKYFDELCNLMSNRFPTLIDYAQPADFWDQYRETQDKNKIQKKRKSRKGKKKKNNEEETEEEEEEVEVEENEASNNSEKTKAAVDNVTNPDDQCNTDIENEDIGSDNEPELFNKSLNTTNANISDLQLEYLFNPSI